MAPAYTQFVLVAVATALFVSGCWGFTDEKRLLKHMLDNYEKVGLAGRPTETNATDDPIDVSVGFYLVQIISFDQHSQVLTLTGMVKMLWTDPLLRWDPEDFGRVENVVIPPELVWTPDVVLYNTVSEPRRVHPARLWVTSRGQVTWVQEYQWDIWCETYLEDTSPACELRFGSWSMPREMMALKKNMDRLNANYYVQNHVYELDKTRAEEEEMEFPFRQGEFLSEVRFSFTLKKRPPKVDESEKDKDNGAAAILAGHMTAAILALVFCLH